MAFCSELGNGARMDATRPIELAHESLRNPRGVPEYVLARASKTRLMRSDWLYRTWLASEGYSLPPERPDLSGEAVPEVRTLQTTAEYEAAVEEVRSLGLRPHADLPKNWDALAALKTILRTTASDARVLDAGGAEYSPLVEWLWLYGYDDLHVQNIDFERDFQRGDISYQQADFTDTGFSSDSLDVVVSLSVLEHGVPIRDALREFHRVLKPGGSLLVSVDYWQEKIETGAKRTTYGENEQEWRVFSQAEVEEALETAAEIGFERPTETQFDVDERTTEWKGESYTFCYFELTR